MRNLIVLRGAPGAGKTSWVKKYALEDYTLSTDSLRRLYSSPAMTLDGWGIHQVKEIFPLMMEVLEYRMKRGETIILDATHYKNTYINKYRDLANSYNYKIYVKTFDVPLEELLERNKTRGTESVPEEVIKKFYGGITEGKIPDYAEEFPDSVDPKCEIPKGFEPNYFPLKTKMTPLDFYDRVHHIGDVHGCYDQLMEFMNSCNEKDAFIFVGDLLDRGPENGKVLQFALDNCHKPNFFFVEGNHERWIRRWLRGKSLSNEFEFNTLPQIKHLPIGAVRAFVKKLVPYVYYTYGNRLCLVTHGGLARLPLNMELLAADQCIRGVGDYNDDIDKVWSDWSKGIVQIHGHRNLHGLSPNPYFRSYNLDGGVEKGHGFLRTLTLNREGFTTKEIVGVRGEKESPPEELQKLRSTKLVKERKLSDGISSFNFTKQAFYKQEWNEITIKARGLFVNTRTNKIAARSYDKFFDVGHFEGLGSLTYPVTVSRKENGFLGLVGWNSNTNDLLICSKSTNGGEYKEMFEQVLRHQVDMDVLKRLVKARDATFVFECIEPIRDPHIIEYIKPEVVLLSIVRNTWDFNPYSVDQVTWDAPKLGCRHPYVNIFSCETDLERFLSQNCEHEGYVLTDKHGKMLKWKSPFYKFWKQMRSYVKNKKEKVVEEEFKETYDKFKKWLEGKDTSQSLIQLRKQFERRDLDD